MTMASTRSGDLGYVAVTVAAVLVILLGFVAIAGDLGAAYSARTAAQKAADAAALAGAFTFVVDTTQPQPQTATNHALRTAKANNILGVALTDAEVTVNVDTVNRRVKVDVNHNMPTFFARVLGQTQAGIHAQAFAEASASATSSFCLKPWFVPNTVFSASAPCTACTAGQVLISGGQPTAFAKSMYGTEFVLKPQQPSGAIAPGQFFAIQFPGSSGANDYRNNIRSCPSTAFVCGTSYSVETGNMVGPTAQGVNDLVGNPPNDTYLAVGQYQHPDGTISDTSIALSIAAIWDACNAPGFCPANKFPSGTNVNLQIVGFALIFIEGIQANAVMARLIDVAPCGGGLNSNEAGPYGLPVRLVRNP
jgi:hypothetical protein